MEGMNHLIQVLREIRDELKGIKEATRKIR